MAIEPAFTGAAIKLKLSKKLASRSIIFLLEVLLSQWRRDRSASWTEPPI